MGNVVNVDKANSKHSPAMNDAHEVLRNVPITLPVLQDVAQPQAALRARDWLSELMPLISDVSEGNMNQLAWKKKPTQGQPGSKKMGREDEPPRKSREKAKLGTQDEKINGGLKENPKQSFAIGCSHSAEHYPEGNHVSASQRFKPLPYGLPRDARATSPDALTKPWEVFRRAQSKVPRGWV